MYQGLTCPPAHPVYVFSCSYVSLANRTFLSASFLPSRQERACTSASGAGHRLGATSAPGSPAGQQHRAPPAPTSAGPHRSACTCTSHCHCHSATHPRHPKLRHLYAGAQAPRPALVPVEGASLRPLCACPSHHSPRPMPRCSRQPLHFVFSFRLLHSPLDWTGAFDEISEREPSEGFELMAFGAKGARAPPAPAARGVAPTQRPRHGRLQA